MVSRDPRRPFCVRALPLPAKPHPVRLSAEEAAQRRRMSVNIQQGWGEEHPARVVESDS